MTNTPAPIIVDHGGEPIEATLLRITPAGIRHVRLPGGTVLRFDRIGFHMGDQRSQYTLPALPAQAA